MRPRSIRFALSGARSAIFVCSFLLANPALADPNDGDGDTPDRPDVWVSTGESGAEVITPGDNQPTEDGGTPDRPTINFDTEPAENSEVVDVPDPPEAADPELR